MIDTILILMGASATLTLALIGAHTAWTHRAEKRSVGPWRALARSLDGRLLEQERADGTSAFMVLANRRGARVELRSEGDGAASAIVLVGAPSRYIKVQPRLHATEPLRGIFGVPTSTHHTAYDLRFVTESSDPDWARGVLGAATRALHLEHPDVSIELRRGCLRLSHPSPGVEELETMATLATHLSGRLEGTPETKRPSFI